MSPVTVDKNGGNHWYAGEERKPGLDVGPAKDRDVEAMFQGTIASTARALRMFRNGIFTEEDFKAGLEINAQHLGIDPEELQDKATQYLDSLESETTTS